MLCRNAYEYYRFKGYFSFSFRIFAVEILSNSSLSFFTPKAAAAYIVKLWEISHLANFFVKKLHKRTVTAQSIFSGPAQVIFLRVRWSTQKKSELSNHNKYVVSKCHIKYYRIILMSIFGFENRHLFLKIAPFLFQKAAMPILDLPRPIKDLHRQIYD